MARFVTFSLLVLLAISAAAVVLADDISAGSVAREAERALMSDEQFINDANARTVDPKLAAADAQKLKTAATAPAVESAVKQAAAKKPKIEMGKVSRPAKTVPGKKAVAKKPVVKKIVKKPVAKKVVMKPVAKKVVKKPVAKKVVKKPIAKKPAPKKPAPKKPVPKKAVPSITAKAPLPKAAASKPADKTNAADVLKSMKAGHAAAKATVTVMGAKK